MELAFTRVASVAEIVQGGRKESVIPHEHMCQPPAGIYQSANAENKFQHIPVCLTLS